MQYTFAHFVRNTVFLSVSKTCYLYLSYLSCLSLQGDAKTHRHHKHHRHTSGTYYMICSDIVRPLQATEIHILNL
jgi:hypothetical protein